MTETDSGSKELQQNPPEGFSIESDGQDTFVIRHKRSGMGCMNAFLIFWLTGWTTACIALLREYLNGGTMDNGNPMPLWFPLIFWTADIVVACLLVYLLFCKKAFRIDRDKLLIETDILGFKRYRTIPRDTVQRIIQVKDGGDDEDSFPSWGLKVQANRKTGLIYRQSHEKSRWLGEILSQWAHVAFTEAPKE